MKKVLFVLVAVVALSFAACAKKATPEECKKACAKAAELQKAANPTPPAEDPAVKVNAEFAQKMQALQNEQAEALKAVEAECAKAKEALPVDKKTKAPKAEDVAKADEACNQKKQETVQGFAPRMAELNKQKADALKAAAAAKAKAEADAKAQAEKELQACADKCVKGGTTKAKVDCQLKAAKFEDFNKCK